VKRITVPSITITIEGSMILIRFSLLASILFCSYCFANDAKQPTWKVELDDPVHLYEFLRDGQYLFFNSGKYAWLYEASTGKEVWKLEVKGYVKDGVHTLVGERYVVSSGNKLQCYDALTGTLQWEREYKDVDQDDFRSLEFIENTAVFRYDDTHLGLDLTNGNELWRTTIRYQGELAEKGTFNYSVLDKQKKMLVIEREDKVCLYDVSNGQRLFTAEKSEVNMDLVNKKNRWMHKAKAQHAVLIVLNDGAIVIDVAGNRELARQKFKIDGDYQVLLPTEQGCGVFGKEKIVHFDFTTGKVVEALFPIGDMRSYTIYKIGGKDILIIGADDRMAAVDLAGGVMLWQTPAKDKQFEGYAHRFIKQDGSSIIFTYNNGEKGATTLFVMSMDGLSGKINYKVPVAMWDGQITGLARTMGKLAGGLVSALRSDDAGEKITTSFGYENIGFEYDVSEYQGNLLITILNKVNMLNPETRKEPGEGFVLLKPQSGEIVYRSYHEIKKNSSWGAAGQGVVEFTPRPLFEGNVAYTSGNGRVLAIDLSTGAKLWQVEKELKDGYPVDIALIEGVVYVKFGKNPVTPGLEKDNVKVNSPWEKDPFGFAAIDASAGTLLWRVETKMDPGVLLPQFSINTYYNAATKQLYFSDEKKIYALRLSRDGGKYDWELDLDKNRVGTMPYNKAFAVNETWLGTKPRTTTTTTSLGGGWAMTTTRTSGGLDEEASSKFIEDAAGADAATTYTSWGNIWGVTAKRCLRVLYGQTRILVFGRDGMSLIDASKGTPLWVAKWDYSHDAVQYIPKVIGNSVVYCVDRKLTCIDLNTGAQRWQTKEAKKPRFFTSPDQRFLFSIDDDVVSGYSL
jgi:outer membrane protein assembly factor BamB